MSQKKERLNVSFDSYAPKSRSLKISPNLNNSSFFARTNAGLNDSFSRKGKQQKLTSFPPTMTLAEFNKVKYSEKPKTTPPDITFPQRIKLPPYFNTPNRLIEVNRENRSPSPTKGNNSLSPPRNGTPIDVAFGLRQKLPTKYDKKVPVDLKVGALRRIKDYHLLSQACKRAGKTREEGRTYYSIGVLYDNIKEYEKAIIYYKKFLLLCQTINDANGEALAYNCLAVDYQLLAEENDPKLYETSIKYHLKHKEIGDTAGKFTACVNLGLIYEKIGDNQNSSIQHQHALRLAVELSNTLNQSIAIGNLGRIGTFELPANKARIGAFVEKYLQICKDANYKEGEGIGYLKLGQILSDQKKYEEGLEKYERAYQIGLETEMQGTVEKAKFGFGIASGLSKIDEHLENYKKKLTSN